MYLTKDEIDRSLAVLKAKMEKGQIILDCDLLESGAEYTFTAVCVSISTIPERELRLARLKMLTRIWHMRARYVQG